MTRRTSNGEMISTLSFLGVAVWLALHARDAGWFEAVALWLSALACLAGALRHVLPTLVERVTEDWHETCNTPSGKSQGDRDGRD